MKSFFTSATTFAILALSSISQAAPSDLIGKTLKLGRRKTAHLVRLERVPFLL